METNNFQLHTFLYPPPANTTHTRTYTHRERPWQTNESENGNFIEGFVFVVRAINRHNLIQLK